VPVHRGSCCLRRPGGEKVWRPVFEKPDESIGVIGTGVEGHAINSPARDWRRRGPCEGGVVVVGVVMMVEESG